MTPPNDSGQPQWIDNLARELGNDCMTQSQKGGSGVTTVTATFHVDEAKKVIARYFAKHARDHSEPSPALPVSRKEVTTERSPEVEAERTLQQLLSAAHKVGQDDYREGASDRSVKRNYDAYNSAETAHRNAIRDLVDEVKRLESHSQQLAEENAKLNVTLTKKVSDVYPAAEKVEQLQAKLTAEQQQSQQLEVSKAAWIREADSARQQASRLETQLTAATKDAEKYSQELVQAREKTREIQNDRAHACMIIDQLREEIDGLKKQREQEETGDGNSPLMLVHRDQFTALREAVAFHSRKHGEYKKAAEENVGVNKNLQAQLSAAHKTAEGLREALAPIVKLAELTARHKDEMGLWHQSDSHGPSFTLTIGDIRKIAALAQSSASSTTEAQSLGAEPLAREEK